MTAVAIPILTARAGRINEAHRKSTEAGRSMLAYAIEAGRELIEVKKGLPHGEFGSWCEANLSFSYRTARNYMKMPEMAARCQFDHEASIRAVLDSVPEKRPTASPALDTDTASRILKLARMANGGNENEEAVAQEMLDKVAARFGMTGEQAQAEASKLCPEPPTHDELVRKAEEFRSRIADRFEAIRQEVSAVILNKTPEEAIADLSQIICVLKYPKEFRNV